jgi:hypothetical protein
MSPAVVQIGAGSAAKDVKRESGTARLLGSGKYPGYWMNMMLCKAMDADCVQGPLELRSCLFFTR